MNLYSIVPVIAIIVIAQTIAYKNDSKLADTLGLTCCGFILVLYILAFFNIITWIDYISVPVLIGVVVWLISNEELKLCFQKFITVQNIIIILFLIFLVFCQYSRLVTWQDDLEFWNVDLKQLWYLDGFAGRYGNAASDYGDYPPAVNLFKWFFTHMNKKEYVEGMGLAGYTCLNFILLLPLCSRMNELVEKKIVLSKEKKSQIKVATNKKYVVSDKRLISKYKVNYTEGHTGEEEQINPVGIIVLTVFDIFACFCLLLLPTIVNKICFAGTSADVTMGIIYGMLLWAIWDEKIEAGKYYYARIAIYGAVIILCKIIGIQWAFMAFIFFIVCYIGRRQNLSFDVAAAESGMKYIISILVFWILCIGSWIAFCFFNARISKITSEGIALLESHDFDISYFLKANSFPFLQGFTVYPMHTDTSGLLDLSVLMIFVVFVSVIIAYAKREIITRIQCAWVLIYTILTAVMAYGIIFIGHLTLFAGEAKYATGKGMGVSLSIYSAPYVLGIFILICGIWFDSIPPMESLRPTTEFAVKEHIQSERLLSLRIFYGVIAGFVLLCCDYSVVYDGLFGFRFDREQVIAERESYISGDTAKFLEEISTKKELSGSRVLYLRNASIGDTDAEPYISNEAAPVSVVYGNIGDGSNVDELWEYISHSHASFVYVDESEKANEYFAQICADGYQTSGLYRIAPGDKIEAYHATLELDYYQGELR